MGGEFAIGRVPGTGGGVAIWEPGTLATCGGGPARCPGGARRCPGVGAGAARGSGARRPPWDGPAGQARGEGSGFAACPSTPIDRQANQAPIRVPRGVRVDPYSREVSGSEAFYPTVKMATHCSRLTDAMSMCKTFDEFQQLLVELTGLFPNDP